MFAKYRIDGWYAVRWLGIVLALSAGVGPLPTALAADGDDAGFVLEISGTWLLDGKPTQKIKAGDKFPAGAKFVPQKPGPTTFVVICFYTGKAQTFTAAGEVPEREGDSFFARIAATVRGNYRSGVVHAVSRGDGLADGIVRLVDGNIDLAPIVDELPAGAYLLQWAPFAADPKDKTQTLTIAWEWNPEQSQPIAAAINAGIYRVQLLNKRTKQATGAEALVLVCEDDGYAARRKTYDEGVTLLETWDESSRKKAGVEFRRAVLRSLAAESDDDAENK